MKTTTTIATDDTVHLLRDTIDRFDAAVLVTHGASGELHARPMVIASTSAEGKMWFITNDATPKVTELEQDRRAMAIMQAPDFKCAYRGMPT